MRSFFSRLRERRIADQLSSARRRWGAAGAQPDSRILENPSRDRLIALIRTERPRLSISSAKILDHGRDNIVVDVNDRWIFRFPRSKETAHRLGLEALFVLFLRRELAIEIPKMEITSSPYLFSYHQKIPGDNLTPQHYLSLNDRERDRISEQIAVFFYQMHRLRPDILISLDSISDHEWLSRDEIMQGAGPLIPERLRDFFQRAMTQYERNEANPDERVIGHFDCHGENMAFDPSSKKLNGIFDFTDAGIGNLHKDFHCLNRVSRDLTGRVITRYQRLSKRLVDRASVDFYTAVCFFSEMAYQADKDQRALSSVLDWFDQIQRLGLS